MKLYERVRRVRNNRRILFSCTWGGQRRRRNDPILALNFTLQMMERMIGATNIAPRHAGTNPERLARTFGIGLPTAKQTLEATTQQHIRQSDGSGGISRRLRSMHKRITDRFRLGVRFYTDVMKTAVAAIGGAKFAQVFSTAYHFTTVVPMLNEKSETIGRAFKEFLIRCGIPFQIVSDNHNSYVGKKSDFYCSCRAISFFTVSSYIFGIVYGLAYTGFAPGISSIEMGSIFHSPS